MKNNFKYIVLASDGVWEFLSNEKVMEIVDYYYKNDNINGSADKLIEHSVRFWRKVYL
jgi:serine/threonine protein phosphatase PrpC